jgi:hypothetical protein
MHFIEYPRHIHLADNPTCILCKQNYLFATWNVVAFLANNTRYSNKEGITLSYRIVGLFTYFNNTLGIGIQITSTKSCKYFSIA